MSSDGGFCIDEQGPTMRKVSMERNGDWDFDTYTYTGFEKQCDVFVTYIGLFGDL